MPSASSSVVRPAAPRRTASVRADLDQRLTACVSASDEAHLLLEISVEADARSAIDLIGQRLLEALETEAFESEIRFGPDMASLRLRRLTGFRVRINASPLAEDCKACALAVLRRLEGLIHADAAGAAGG